MLLPLSASLSRATSLSSILRLQSSESAAASLSSETLSDRQLPHREEQKKPQKKPLFGDTFRPPITAPRRFYSSPSSALVSGIAIVLRIAPSVEQCEQRWPDILP